MPMQIQLTPFHSNRAHRFFVLAGFVQVSPLNTKAAFHVMTPNAPPELFSTSIVNSCVWVESGALEGALIVKAVPFVAVIT